MLISPMGLMYQCFMMALISRNDTYEVHITHGVTAAHVHVDIHSHNNKSCINNKPLGMLILPVGLIACV